MKAPVAVSRQSRGDVAFQWLINAIAVLIGLITLYPLIYTLSASLSAPLHIMRGDVVLFPVGFTLDSYRRVFASANILNGYKNTLIYAFSGTAINLVLTIMAAYPLSLPDLRGKSFFTFMITFTMFFSGGLIPIFLTVQQAGLYNTFWVLVLPFSVSAYNIIVARTFFETSLPPDLWDAAQIDGCGNLRFFFTMALPLSKAVISVIALWTAVGQWNSYFNALIYIRDENLYPLQLIMRNILITNQNFAALGTGEAAMIAMRRANLVRYAMIIVATVPIMCVYPFIQKYFDQGVMIGAVKG